MINLTSLTLKYKANVPIFNNKFQYNKKKFYTKDIKDGWYTVTLHNNDVIVENEILPEIDIKVDKSKIISGYTHGTNLIFFNFDEGKRKLQKEISCKILLNNVRTFSAVNCIIWEDNNLYLHSLNLKDDKIVDLRSYFERDQLIADKKGLTPEQKTVFLFHYIEREQQRALQRRIREEQDRLERMTKAQRERELAMLEAQKNKQSMQEALTRSFASVGAELKFFEVKDNLILADWYMDGLRITSKLNKQTFAVVDAGFCMSGDDRRHTVSSMVITAKQYEEDDKLHIW